MKILLTGGSGLVGRNILENPRSSYFNIIAPSSSELDLLDYNSVSNFLGKHSPDFVVHCAGRVGGIHANIKNPSGFLLDNLDMGRNLLLASKLFGIEKFLNIGSSCMYPCGIDKHLTEDMLLAGKLEPTNEGYALAKIVAHRLCDYFSNEFNLSYKTIVPCNIYGRYDSFSPQKSHLVPAIIDKLHNAIQDNHSSVEIWGDGNARREFMYAGDLADCIFECISRFDEMPQTMNVGIGKDYTINHYYHVAAKVLGFQGSFTHDLTRPVGMSRKVVSIDKQLVWGWQSSTSLEAGIEMTYNFYVQRNRHDI